MEIMGKNLKIITILLITIIGFYLVFLYIDLYKSQFNYVSTNLKFISIISCFIISLLTNGRTFDSVNLRLLQWGLFLTVIADFFLLKMERYNEIGVLIFSLVQIIYSVRYDVKNRNKIIRDFLIIFLVLNGINFIFVRARFIYVIALFYGIGLISNLVKAVNIYIHGLYPKINGLMVALGMFLFLLCDINVALYNILKYMNKTDGIIYSISSISIWLYYLPSQVLLSLSGYKFKE